MSTSTGTGMNLGGKLLLNWTAVAVGVLLGIGLYRFQLGVLGPTVLGTWVAISAVCGYLSLLELGLGAALSKSMAAHRALGDQQRLAALLSTALFLYMALGLLALAGGAALAAFAGPLLRLPPALLAEGRRALLLLALNVSASFVLCVYRGVLFGSGRTHVIAAVTIARHLLYATLVVSLLTRKGSLVALAGAGLCADLVSGLCLYAFARAEHVPVGLGRPCPAIVRELLGYSGAVVLITVGMQLLRSSMLPLLQRALGPEVVTAYAPAERLCTLFFTLVSQMGVVLVPQVAAACAVHPENAAIALSQAGRLGMALGLPPLVVLLGLGDSLLIVWLGPTFSRSAIYLHVLGLAMLAQLVSFGMDIGAYAVGGRRAYGLVKLAAGAVAVVAIWAGLRLGGALGGALASALCIALCDAVAAPIAVCRTLQLPAPAYYAGVLRRAPLALALLLTEALLLRACHPVGLPATLLFCAAGTVVGWGITYLAYLGDADRALLRSRLHVSAAGQPGAGRRPGSKETQDA
jgi:O-antigen/teichoic acid export membrane protein